MWIATTPDEYELPIAVADTAEELARMLNVSVMAVYKSKERQEKNIFKSNRTYKVFKID